ncbi:MAG: hypothetical protein ACEY3D_03245 [Rickettsia sp.]
MLLRFLAHILILNLSFERSLLYGIASLYGFRRIKRSDRDDR